MEYQDDKLPMRFWKKVYPEPNTGCWFWGGGENGKGYGRFELNYKYVYPHRLTMEYSGPLVIDHLCYQRTCCNPDHLEVVTNQVNTQRGWDRRKQT